MSLEATGDTQPTTFAEAFAQPAAASAQTDSPTVDTSTTDEPSRPTPESATTSPGEPTKVEEVPRDDVGPIPVSRHKALLEAERAKYTDLDAKWKRVQWASELVEQGATADQVRNALGTYRDLNSDPVRFFRQLLTEASEDEHLTAQLRSVAGSVLGTGRAAAAVNGNGQPQGQDEPEPPPDMFDSATGIQGYSASQQRKHAEWNERRILAKVAEDNKPIKEWWQSQQARDRQAQQAQAFNAEVKGLLDVHGKRLDELKKLGTDAGYYDDTFKAKMSEYAKSKNFNVTPDEAWNHVYHTHILPTQSQRERSRYDAELRTKANASSVNPKSGASSVPANITRLDDPRLWK